MSTLKDFLMTLAATTVSIILTFGTTAIIDRKKQNAEKREMVMMILYDMSESLKEIENNEKNLITFHDTQVDIVAHPQQFSDSYPLLAAHVPILEYSSTTENIFRSNIETISTIGNILFVQNVSLFYDRRSQFSKDIVDDFQHKALAIIGDYQKLSEFDAAVFPFYGHSLIMVMRKCFEQCKLMMKVSDKDLEVFSTAQQKLLEALEPEDPQHRMDYLQELQQRRDDLQKARQAGKTEWGE